MCREASSSRRIGPVLALALTGALLADAVTGAACSGGAETDANGVVARRTQALTAPLSVSTPNGDPQATIMSASSSLTIDDRATVGAASGPLEIVGTFGAPRQWRVQVT